MTQLLRDAFINHEHLAPDPDLEAIHGRIRTRRRSRLAVTGAVIAVAGIVAVAVGVGAYRSDHRVATPSVQSADYVSIAPGWLPSAHARQQEITNLLGYQTRTYVMPRGTPLISDVQLGTYPGTSLPWGELVGKARGQRAHDLTIDGHPARESFIEELYMLAVRLTDDQIASVQLGTTADASGPAVRDIARRVLTTMSFDHHDLIGSEFTLTYLPPGLTVRGVDRCYNVEPTIMACGQTTVQTLASATASGIKAAYPTVMVSITSWQNSNSQKIWSRAPFTTKPGRLVHGRPTWVVTSPEHTLLWVDSVRPGRSVVINSGPGLTNIDDMYRVADGLILS